MNHYQDTAEESLKWTWKIKPPLTPLPDKE